MRRLMRNSDLVLRCMSVYIPVSLLTSPRCVPVLLPVCCSLLALGVLLERQGKSWSSEWRWWSRELVLWGCVATGGEGNLGMRVLAAVLMVVWGDPAVHVGYHRPTFCLLLKTICLLISFSFDCSSLPPPIAPVASFLCSLAYFSFPHYVPPHPFDLLPTPSIHLQGLQFYCNAALCRLVAADSQCEAGERLSEIRLIPSEWCLQDLKGVLAAVSRGKDLATWVGRGKAAGKLWEWRVNVDGGEGAVWAEDVTEKEKWRENAEQEIAAKAALIRSFSHEVHTPLNAITYLCKELQSSSPSSFHTTLQLLSTNCALLHYVLSDVIDYAQALAGKFDIVKAEFKLRPCLNRIIDLFRYQVDKKNLRLKVAIDPLLPTTVWSDERKFGQVVLNLISNAVKYTLKGGIEIEVSLLDSGQMRIVVRDTGIGIEEAHLEGIFKMHLFDEAKGAGVGLFVSTLLAQRLGSPRIFVLSSLSQGSTFWLDIDITPRPLAPLEYSPTTYSDFTDPPCIAYPRCGISRPMDLRRINERGCPDVLIVDDNEFNRTILRMMLDKLGLTSEEAITGLHAVRQVLKHRETTYKLVIMDVEMPEMGGIEATRLILNKHLAGEIGILPKIVALTAYPSSQVRAQCVEAGMDDFLSKPLAMDRLMEVVCDYCHVSKSHTL